MHEPIFERLGHELHDVARHLAHHDQPLPSTPAAAPREAAMADTTSTATRIEDIIAKGEADLAEAVTAARSWAGEIDARGAKVAQAALGPITALASNKVAKWLVENELHVPDQLVETVITMLKAIAGTAPAPAAAPAEPAPAQ